uniref:Uncharacterized protein n=1 Tax=Strongyloides venezuelensis TaxID=75913 RepID=A0A0K0FFY4_STRVS
MGVKEVLIGPAIFLFVLLLIGGIEEYCYFKNSCQSKNKKKRRSSRSSSRSSSSSDKEKRKSRKIDLQSTVGFLGEIKVDIEAKTGTVAPINDINVNIVLPPPVIDQGPKRDTPSNPVHAPVDQTIQHKVIVEKPDTPKDILPPTTTLPAPVEIHEPKITQKVAFEVNQPLPEVANDLLKAKTNTHYIPPTTIAPEVTVPSQNNTPENGSLLTSNNLTYNTVNIMVNNNTNEDINEVIENAVKAIPDPNLNISKVPGLPQS